MTSYGALPFAWRKFRPAMEEARDGLPEIIVRGLAAWDSSDDRIKARFGSAGEPNTKSG